MIEEYIDEPSLLDENFTYLSKEDKEWLREYFFHDTLPCLYEINKRNKYCLLNNG